MSNLRLVIVALMLVVPRWAEAQQFWEKQALLSDMFPTSERVSPTVLQLDGDATARAKSLLGYNPPKSAYTFYVATTGTRVDGYALFDEQIGQHEPITFAVQLSADGVVLRHEVVVYRERYGAEVRNARFREQFVGKTSADPIAAGKDIRIVSGATYSSKAMALGVKRAAVLAELLVSSQDATADP